MDQQLKSTIHEANMTLTNGQHHAWFVESLAPHLRMALSQHKLSTQAEALEMAMRLHETLIQDPGLGVQQIHAQLYNLCLEMQSLKQDRAPLPEACEEVWCIKCKGQGDDKDHCPVFANYLARVGPMLLRIEVQAGPSVAPALWCAIYQIGGKHTTDNCHLLQRYTQTPQQLFYNFCKSVGNAERTYCNYELMMDQTPAYMMQTKTRALDPDAGLACTGFQGRGRKRRNGTRKGPWRVNLL